MRHALLATAVGTLLLTPWTARAGLYYSGEPMAELPSQWRGFLIDQRILRSIAAKPAPGAPASPARLRYLKEAEQLQKAAGERKLTADELADLGALHVRLGEPARAIAVLRQAQRTHPNHFQIAANLGTAWQMQGDLEQAALALQQAVRLAPEKYQKAEEYHLKLVRLRMKQRGASAEELDDLFGVRYVDEGGGYTPGKLAAAEKKKLPAHAPAVAQQLALWLPADGRLLWQLAELANAYGDMRHAAAMMDGCVTQFGMASEALKRNRRLTRAAADGLAKAGGDKEGHEGHAGTLLTRSKRPLLTRLDAVALPPIDPRGVNALPWALLGDTTLDRKYRPTFPKYLQDLDGKTVAVTGFMQPLRDDAELAVFLLIEYPVGCWYCETPESTGMLYVELEAGRSVSYTRGLMRVTGRLALNATDPEDFFFILRDAKVAEVD